MGCVYTGKTGTTWVSKMLHRYILNGDKENSFSNCSNDDDDVNGDNDYDFGCNDSNDGDNYCNDISTSSCCRNLVLILECVINKCYSLPDLLQLPR